MNPIQTLLAVSAIGGQLGIAGDMLRMLLPASCPPELKAAIRKQKRELIALLRLSFLIVRSEALAGTVLFWAADETTKEALVAAGAAPGMVYTPEELKVLVNRRISAAELPAIHHAKRTFDGRISP